MVPAATAKTAAAPKGLDRAALGAARAAARQAPTHAAAVDAFVGTYVRISGDVDAERALVDVLLGDAVGEVPPPAPPVAVAASASPAAPVLRASALAALPAPFRLVPPQATEAVVALRRVVPRPAAARRTHAARAP